MQFFKTFRPFINSFTDKNNKNGSQDKGRPVYNSQQSGEAGVTSPGLTSQLSYADAQCFILELRQVSLKRNKQDNDLKCKIDLFEKVQVQPLYLEDASEDKLLNFQFQLGSDIFLERTQHLHQQISQINKVVKQVLATRTDDTFRYLDSVKGLENSINSLIKRIKAHRERLRQLKEYQAFKVSNLIRKKAVIKEKIKLLKSVRAKNEAAFVQITNIDQAFATEQSRCKLYKKINKLTELQKSKYVGTIKNKLISTCQNNRNIVQERINYWAQGKLNEKQVEKVAFMIYFMETSQIYVENNIAVDFQRVNKTKLAVQVKKIFEWKKFTYVSDLMTKEKIHQFLNYLIQKIAPQRVNK